MHKAWALLIAAFVVGFAALHVRHVRRAHPVATMSVASAGHHHHVRAHRTSATIAEGPSLEQLQRAVAEPVIAPVIEAPTAPIDAPVARGPPRS